MIWHAGIHKGVEALSRYLSIGLAIGCGLLAVALWTTSARLADARGKLAQAQAGLETCLRAHATARATISELQVAQAQNAARRVAALSAQIEAVARIRELEAINREPEIIRIREAASGDACADLPVPDAVRVRLNPRGDRVSDSDRRGRAPGAGRSGADQTAGAADHGCGDLAGCGGARDPLPAPVGGLRGAAGRDSEAWS